LLTSSEHNSLRGMCDGLVGSQSRGAPGCVRDQRGKQKSVTLMIPGIDTWSRSVVILPALNRDFSKILFEVQGVKPEFCDYIATKSELSTFLLGKCELFFSKLLRKTIGEAKQKLLDSMKKEFHKISKFCLSSISTEFFIFKDKYILDVLDFVVSELTILSDCIPKFHEKFTLNEQARLLINSYKIKPELWIKAIKYHTACPQSILLKNDKPPMVEGMSNFWIWSGPVKRFLKNIFCRRPCKLNRDLAFGFLQGIKRGCRAVPTSFLEKEVEKHVIAMTTPPVFQPINVLYDKVTGRKWEELDLDPNLIYPDHNPENRVYDIIEDTFSSTLDSILYPTRRGFKVKTYEPSHNSSFERSRGLGGSYAEVIHQLNLPIETVQVPCKGVVKEYQRYTPPEMEDVLDIARKKVENYQETSEMLTSFASAFGDETMEGYLPGYKTYTEKRRPMTAVIPLSEPLKVRIITKGEALNQYCAKSLQKQMKTYINRYPSLVLTTRPLLPEDFDVVWTKEKELFERLKLDITFDKHVSGDYSAATDKLNCHFTRAIFERFLVILKVPERDREVYREVLYSQRLDYPKEYCKSLIEKFPELNVSQEKGGFAVDQQNGQLMGSILSFPILCIANLACYKLALERYMMVVKPRKRPYSIHPKDLPVLVNGDDIYFRTNDVFYTIWKEIITFAGFELSIGKNYVHADTFTINSQMFTYLNGTLTETTYLNVGLLKGQSKSGAAGEKLPLWDLYNKVLTGCQDKFQTHKRFLYYHKDHLREVSGTNKQGKSGLYNYFLPRMLGGLGFIRFSEEIPVRLTEFQNQLGTFFHNQIANMCDSPHVGKPALSSIKIVDKNALAIPSPYKGEPIYMTLPLITPIPVGFELPNKLETEDRIFCNIIPQEVLDDPIAYKDTEIPHWEPKLCYRGISSDVLKQFRSSNKNRTGVSFFGLKDALTGNYPYKLVRSIVDDVETHQANLNFLFCKDIVGDLIDSIFPGTDESVPIDSI